MEEQLSSFLKNYLTKGGTTGCRDDLDSGGSLISGNTREGLIDIPDNEKGPPVCLENEELSDEGPKEGNDEVADEVIESDHGDDIEEGDGLNVKTSVGEDNIKLHYMIEKCDTSSSIDDLDGGIISSESALGNAEDHDLYDDESEKKVIDDVITQNSKKSKEIYV